MQGLWIFATLIFMLWQQVAYGIPPGNDQCAGATSIILDTDRFDYTENTLEATSINDPILASALQNGVWFIFTAPTNGSLRVNTAGSTFNTVIAAFANTCAFPVLVGEEFESGSASSLSFDVNAGSTYRVLVGGYQGAAGLLEVHAKFDTVRINDQCSGAFAIQGTPYTSSQFTDFATSTNDPYPDLHNGVWYQFTATTNGVLKVDTQGSDFYTMLVAYTGSCGSLVYLDEDDENDGVATALSIAVTNGLTYRFLVGGIGQSGRLKFNATFNTNTVANDQCKGARLVTGNHYTNTQSTANATSTGDPDSLHVRNGVWYVFTPADDGLVSVDTYGSDFNHILAVFSGVCGSLSFIDQFYHAFFNETHMSFRVTHGVSYYFLVGGYYGETGTLKFQLDMVNAPANDLCAGALLITGTGYTNTQSTEWASSIDDPGIPAYIGNGVWYAYAATNNGVVSVDTHGSSFDTVLSAFSGACGSLDSLGYGDNDGPFLTSVLSIGVTKGVTYYFLAGGSQDETGILQFHFTFTSAPPNDACSDALVITGIGYTNVQSTALATSTGDPEDPPELVNGVWYKYTATRNGELAVDTRGSSFDTLLAAYSGSCGSLFFIDYNDEDPVGGISTSALSIAVTNGVTYYFLAGGWLHSLEESQTGQLIFHARDPNFVSPPTILTTGSGFGVQTNRFGFNMSAGVTQMVVIEARTNLTTGTWVPLQTNLIGPTPTNFSEPFSRSNKARFYRLRSQ